MVPISLTALGGQRICHSHSQLYAHMSLENSIVPLLSVRLTISANLGERTLSRITSGPFTPWIVR